MIARSTRLAVQAVEDRCMPATVATGDFNHDGRDDIAAITSPTTVTVSLANPNGIGYTVSAVLTVPAKQPIASVTVWDYDGDGNLDIAASGSAGGNWMNTHRWLGNGDGTFDEPTSNKWRWPPPPGHSRNWV